MFRQPRNAKRASRACKVGQLGIEQLDARVVPSVGSVGTLATAAIPADLSHPSPKFQPDVLFDESGNAIGAKQLTSFKGIDVKDLQITLDRNNVPDLNFKGDGSGELKGGGIVYQLKDANIKDDFVAVGVTEQQQKDHGPWDSSHKNNEETSDILLFVKVKTEQKDDHGQSNDFGKSKPKEVTLVFVFSDSEKGERNAPPADSKKDLDVRFKDVDFNRTFQEDKKGNVDFSLAQAKSSPWDSRGKTIDFRFFSDSDVKKPHDN